VEPPPAGAGGLQVAGFIDEATLRDTLLYGNLNNLNRMR
jgi:hypothetical protein